MIKLGLIFLGLAAFFFWAATRLWQAEDLLVTLSVIFALLSAVSFSIRKDVA